MQKYNSFLPISAAKKDLIRLCKTGAIPAIFLPFHQSLPSDASINDRLPEQDVNEYDIESDMAIQLTLVINI